MENLPEYIEALRGIGLSKNESKVYLALLKLGSSNVISIAKTSTVHRVNVYDALKKLQERGLVSTSQIINKTEYQAADPNLLETIMIEKNKFTEVNSPTTRNLKTYFKDGNSSGNF